jgi:hypothetical protein
MKNVVASLALVLATSAFAADPPKAPAPASPPAKPAAATSAAKPAAAPAAAPAPTSTPAAHEAAPPPPAPELSAALKPLEGKWRCDGKAPDSQFAKAHAVKADLALKSDLNGYWYVARYEEKKTKENANPYAMNASYGFDPSKKQLVRTDTDNMGMITHLASKGWEGDKLAWAGDVMGPQKMQFRETLTKKSDREVMTMMELAGPDGKWVTLQEMTCKK